MPFALFSPWIVKVKFLEPLNCQGLIYMANIQVRSNSSPREWSYCCTVDAAAAAEEQVAVRIPGSSPHIPVRTRFAEGRVADKPAAAAAPAAPANSSRCFRKHHTTHCRTGQAQQPASRQHSAGLPRDQPSPGV